MNLKQLEFAVALAEEGNFTRAAERCHVVQSALSHQIAYLEQELGTPLFERLPRQVRATAAGEALLVHARQVLVSLRHLRATCAPTWPRSVARCAGCWRSGRSPR